jgi:tyrosyl-tRNA synthetase
MAQIALASEMTLMIHGETGLQSAQQASDVLFGGSLDGLSVSDIEDIFADVPKTEFSRALFASDGPSMGDLLVESGLCASKSEARRLTDSGGITVNNERCNDIRQPVGTDLLIGGKFLILRKGKKNFHLVRVLD